jgi:hypothetical protein
MEVLV